MLAMNCSAGPRVRLSGSALSPSTRARAVAPARGPASREFKVTRAADKEEAGVSTQVVEPEEPKEVENILGGEPPKKQKKAPLGKGVNLFDPAATISRFITRRFGIVGGLGFVALLASTEGYEIVRALLETEKEGSGEVVETASGLSYKDIKIGGGGSPKKGDFVGANFEISIGDKVLLDTKAAGRPIAFTFGRRPYAYVVNAGVEEGVSTMKRGGVRELTIPPSLGYGDKGTTLPNGAVVPPGATLTYKITLEEVSASYL